MKIEFIKLSPTQNMTILVKNFYEKSQFIEVANKLLDYGNVYAEQVGFITVPKSDQAFARLDMMGGEFCGNATMSLASLIARDNNYKLNEEKLIKLEVSGADGIVDCYVTPKENYYIGKVKIPAPYEVNDTILNLENENINSKIVNLHGITHIFINNKNNFDKMKISEEIIKNYKKYTNQDALGILFYNFHNSFMYPIVYVVSTNSIIHERCCGSGSAAIATLLSMSNKKTETFTINQPGGSLKVTPVYINEILKEIWIEGKVHIVAEGFAYV